jgi:hypothetical protein
MLHNEKLDHEDKPNKNILIITKIYTKRKTRIK